MGFAQFEVIKPQFTGVDRTKPRFGEDITYLNDHNNTMPTLAPVLDQEEYIEQAYFFHAFRQRQLEGQPSQEVLSRIDEELLSTTRLPMAVQFMATELKHTGLLGSAVAKLPHYFTPFQAFVIGKSEEEGL